MKVAYKDDYITVLCKMVGLITANGKLIDFMHSNLKNLSDEQMAEYMRLIDGVEKVISETDLLPQMSDEIKLWKHPLKRQGRT